MSRLHRHGWKVSSSLLYAGVVGCAILVASLVSIGLETNGSPPVPRAATVDRSTPQIWTLHVATTTTASRHPAGARRTATTPLPSGPTRAATPGSGAAVPGQAGSYPVASPPVAPPTTTATAVQPLTVSPDRTVVELPSPDTASQPPSTESASSSSPDSTTATTTGNDS